MCMDDRATPDDETVGCLLIEFLCVQFSVYSLLVCPPEPLRSSSSIRIHDIAIASW